MAEIGLLLLGAAVSFIGGFYARSLEQRRQARIDMLRLFDEMEETFGDLVGNPTNLDAANRLRRMGTAIRSQGLLIGIQETVDSLELSALTRWVANSCQKNRNAEKHDEAWQLRQTTESLQDEITNAGEDEGTREAAREAADIMAKSAHVTEDYADTPEKKAARVKEIESLLSQVNEKFQAFEHATRHSLMIVPLRWRASRYVEKLFRRLIWFIGKQFRRQSKDE
jgi:hypothetical protein